MKSSPSICHYVKVSKFQNGNMKSSHCPKYERKNLKNSALSIQGRIFQNFRSYIYWAMRRLDQESSCLLYPRVRNLTLIVNQILWICQNSLPQICKIFNGTWFFFLFSLLSPHLPRMMPRHWLAAVWRDFLSRKNFLVEITQKISAEKTRLGTALRLVHFTRVAIPNFFGVDACWIDLLCKVWFYKKLRIGKSTVLVRTFY